MNTSYENLSKTAREQVLLINSMERNEVKKYIGKLKQALYEGKQSINDLLNMYNDSYFKAIEEPSSRLSLVTTLMLLARERNIDPPSLWTGIYVRGGFI